MSLYSVVMHVFFFFSFTHKISTFWSHVDFETVSSFSFFFSFPYFVPIHFFCFFQTSVLNVCGLLSSYGYSTLQSKSKRWTILLAAVRCLVIESPFETILFVVAILQHLPIVFVNWWTTGDLSDWFNHQTVIKTIAHPANQLQIELF